LQDFQFSAEVNVFDGTVDLRSQNSATMQSLLSTDLQQNKNIRLIQVENVSSNTATIYGGRKLTGTQQCTSGFNVKYKNTDSIVTTGHCDDTMTLSGVTFKLVERTYRDSYQFGLDLQIMSATGTHAYPNEVFGSATMRVVINSAPDTLTYPIDWPICVYGATTNAQRCGKIKAKSVALKDNNGITNAVNRGVSDDGKAFNQGGDSGGPVLVGNTAIGLIKAKGSAIADLYFVDLAGLNNAQGGLTYVATVKTGP
jgi:hypothetical protein